VGGIVGLALAAVAYTSDVLAATLWASFLFQIGFIAYLSVFINLNPLLELDGYFILMDWLDVPGLRSRAFRFWREQLWPHFRVNPHPRHFWAALRRSERIFTLYGALAFVYSVYALAFAAYFWQTRLLPLVESLWRDHGLWGQLLVLLVTTVVVIPAVYYLIHYGWSQVQAALEWLARRDLLARPDVLALLVGLPLLAGLPLILAALTGLRRGDLFLNLVIWLLHLAAVAALVAVARQLPGSRFQWALWALVLAPLAMALAWLAPTQFWRELGLMIAGAAILAAGTVAWYTVGPTYLALADRIVMALIILAGTAYYTGAIVLLQSERRLATALIVGVVFTGLALMSPLFVNFSRSRFALPWLLLAIAIASLPLLQFYPLLHLPVAALWLYAGLLYLLVAALAQFHRHDLISSDAAAFGERARLVDSFNHFIHAIFAGYEAVFGGRRLVQIQAQMAALGPLDPDAGIFQIAERARQALLLVVDRLDDLAGTPLTRRAGQAAYDSLPWLEAETLARHVLADTDWGSQLARGFIQTRDRRAALLRQADIFAGFDEDAVEQTLAIARSWTARSGVELAQVDREAIHFFLIEAGEVGVYHGGVQVATLTAGGYFGLMALRGHGPYLSTYRTLSPVRLLAIHRDHFDPLLRADTTLSSQVRSSARERELLKRMPLFSSLSPQQLTAVGVRMQTRHVEAGEVVVRQGQQRSHLFIVAEGQIEVVHEREADEAVIGVLGPGEHFGEYALFADKPYHATYRAAVKSRLLLLDEARFDQLVTECEHMTHYVEQIGSSRLIATRRRLDLTAILS
jgi:putative peptide zinc metalloprotease protein